MNTFHRISKVGLVAIIASVLSTVEARPKKDKEKPDKPRPEKKVDREKVLKKPLKKLSWALINQSGKTPQTNKKKLYVKK